jgi:hypothetical protein
MRRYPHIRALLLAAIFLTVLAGFADSAWGGYKPNHPDYPRLTARELGMGGACVAFTDDGNAIFQNPAGLGRIRTLTISHSHSREHFPGENMNLDRLDCDPTSLIVPLSGATFGYPIGSAGAGWVLQGELGYDYSVRNDESVPNERLWGMGPVDRADGAGFHLWPGGYLGFTHRKSEYLFSTGDDLPDGVTWRRSGEGYSVGIQQTIISGIQYGHVFEQMDYDYQPFRDDIEGERTKSNRSGWCIRPTGWLTIARDVECFSLKEHPSREETRTTRIYWGCEIEFGPWLSWRWGSFDGHATHGWSWKIGPWRSDSARVEGFMPEMVENYPEQWQDFHTTGFNLGE